MKRLIIGITLLLLSFAFDLFPLHHLSYIVFYSAIFCLGLIIIYDSIVFIIKGHSLLRGTSNSFLTHILIAGAISGVLIEGICNWLFKLWIYPFIPSLIYIISIPLLLSFYFFLLLENYQAVVVLIERYIKIKPRKLQNRKDYNTLFSLFGIIGIIGFISTTSVEFLNYTLPPKFLEIFNTFWYVKNNIFLLFLLPVSFWLIIEYLEWTKKEDTFLIHLFEGDWIPFLAIIISSFITSIVMEVFNLPIKVWVYTNWPFQNILFLGVPVIIIAFWPFQYLLFVSLYKYMYKEETVSVWDDNFLEKEQSKFVKLLRKFNFFK